MGNILSYMKEYGEYTFLEKEINDVDSLILAQFSYFNFDSLVPGIQEGKPAVSMRYIRQHADYENLFAVDWYKDELRELFECMAKCKRYRNMKCNYFVNYVNQEEQTQFSAVTFFLGDGNIYIAFRGTDNALIGWKEDFNMAYLTPIPSQKMSVEYIGQVAEALKHKRKVKYYMGGHSKGGNLAVYAALNCGKRFQDKLIAVYNLDGPGFRPEFFDSFDYAAVKDKIKKIIPQSSFVGMLLQPNEDYQVISSNVTGIMQHLPLTWRVMADDFVHVEKMSERKKEIDDEFNEWILSMDKTHMSEFLDAIYYLIDSTNASSLKELMERWPQNMLTMISTYHGKKFDDNSKEIFWKSTNLFLKLIAEESSEKIRRMGLLQNFRERIEASGESGYCDLPGINDKQE